MGMLNTDKLHSPGDVGDLEQRAQQTLHQWVARANRLFEPPRRAQIPCPRLSFNLRGRSAGMAVYQPRKRRAEPDLIRINAGLLQEHPDEMLEETIPHEVAHIVAHRLFGPRIKPHGAEWRAVMAAFGKSPEVQHRMEVEPSRRLRRYRYHCACPAGVELTSIRHNRARRGTGYVCRKCGQRLRWSGDAGKEQTSLL